MDYIKFKKNYNNKLDNSIFTTIRPDDPIRYQLGFLYNIICDECTPFEARIARIKPYYNLEDIPLKSIRDDTGIDSFDEFKSLMEQFYGKDKKGWVLIVLQKI